MKPPVWIRKGAQICYLPMQARGKVSHPDVQYGFVVSVTEEGALCRYFRSKQSLELRKEADAQLVDFDSLRPCVLHGQRWINELVEQIGDGLLV